MDQPTQVAGQDQTNYTTDNDENQAGLTVINGKGTFIPKKPVMTASTPKYLNNSQITQKLFVQVVV